MPVTKARYHVNPENRVLRCTAGPNGSCRYAGAAHFEGMTRDEAKFMQDTLAAATPTAKPVAKPAPKLATAAAPVPAKVAKPFPRVDGTYGAVQVAPERIAPPTVAQQRWRSEGALLDGEQTSRVLARQPQAWESVRRLNPVQASRLRAAFRLEFEGQVSTDDEDLVYLHESENAAGTRLDSLSVQWGARSWAQEKVTFFHEHGDLYAQLDTWLAENGQ